jgi:hypothetical protein
MKIALLSAATLVATLASSGAYALSNRTFVSGNGSDSNPCSIAAPCRSFAGAIAQTSQGGEIAVLDTAGYGAVTINKAISIVNEEGVEAGISVTSGDGITITANSSDVVNLRGLTIVGAGGDNGITFNRGGNLNIQNCVIRGFSTSSGLNLQPTGNFNADINVSNTIVSGNGFGIVLAPLGAPLVTASFAQVQAIHNSSRGFLVDGSNTPGILHALAADSLASGNGLSGFSVHSENGATTFTLVNSKAANNGIGVESVTNATMFLNGTTVTGNTTGFAGTNGGAIASYGNNAITDTSNTGGLGHASLQ